MNVGIKYENVLPCYRTGISEGIDVNKTSLSLWYFLNYSFPFQPNVCNNCRDLWLMSVNLSSVFILNIKGSHYCCIISLISKNETIKLLKNADLTDRSGLLEKLVKKFFNVWQY